MKLRTLSTLAWLALAGLPAAPAAITYVVTDLGVAEADDHGSYARAINAAGQICGQSGAGTVSTPYLAFLYDAAQSPPMQSLGALPGSTHSFARDINAGGTVVGFSRTADDKDHAFARVAGGTMTKVPLSDIESYARGVNDAGALVGWLATIAYNSHAYLFDPALPQAQQFTDIGALIQTHLNGGINVDSRAYAINNAGQIVGYYGTGNGFLYDPTQSPKVSDLGAGEALYAYDINDTGLVTGEGYAIDGAIDTQAFIYDTKASPPTVKGLGWLPGSSYSGCHAINNFGQVVGWGYFPATDDYHAMLWDGAALRDLNDLIPAGSGWVLQIAYDINDSGVIVGEGKHDGQPRAFRLAPVFTPDPITPTVRIAGKRKLVTTNASVRVKGTAAGAVTAVSLRNGRKPVRVAGTASWSAKVRLKPGRNKLTATATGPGGVSAPARLTITRK